MLTCLTVSCLVTLFRSEIHGRGLFCKRNIEAGEMVIEYAGNVIRAVLTDKREKYYDSKVSKLHYCTKHHHNGRVSASLFCMFMTVKVFLGNTLSLKLIHKL